MADVACRWSIRPEHLSRIAADENRDLKWDDLVRSLPTLSPFERSCVTAARLSLIPPKPRRRKGQPIGEAIQSVDAEAAGGAVQPDPLFKWEHGDEEDEDIEPLGDRIDLGLVAIEALALALPPYPRKEGAALAETLPDDAEETETVKPFAALAALRDKLDGGM